MEMIKQRTIQYPLSIYSILHITYAHRLGGGQGGGVRFMVSLVPMLEQRIAKHTINSALEKVKIGKKILNVQICSGILKIISSSIKNKIRPILGVNKTCASPLTYAVFLYSISLSWELTNFMEYDTSCIKIDTVFIVFSY